jgi:hypothetical protein
MGTRSVALAATLEHFNLKYGIRGLSLSLVILIFIPFRIPLLPTLV